MKVVDRESTLIPRKIEEAMHSLKNANQINKFYCMVQAISLVQEIDFLIYNCFTVNL